MNKIEDSLFEVIQNYSERNGATNSIRALDYLSSFVNSIEDENRASHILHHALAVSEMFINLQLPMSSHDKDIAIASCLLHVLPTHMPFAKVMSELDVEEEVFDIVDICTVLKNNLDIDDYYKKVQENRIALTVLLIQRSDRVSRLHELPVYAAKRYIYETRRYYFPMCVYAKDHYPELYGAVSIMLEKMRCIIDTVDILMSRFEKEENELISERLRLQEENSRIRKIMELK